MKFKKLIAAILAAMTALTFAACGEKNNDDTKETEESTPVLEENVQTPETEAPTTTPEISATPEASASPEATPAPTPTPKPEATPAPTPTPKPQATPEPTPVPTPKPEPQKKTVGQTLLADFKAKAGSTSGAYSLAEKLVANSIIPFAAMTMPVEPGMLPGFGNTEIKGFKDGATFGPMIGSIPFIGYVFVLEDGTNTSDFVALLKKNADLRWNICVEAEEIVTGSAGNKVFFVMCPKEFSEE